MDYRDLKNVHKSFYKIKKGIFTLKSTRILGKFNGNFRSK